MPTTSNFGWTTPADTDLVKDGAAAIRTLGNNIDASLVDLKGGTTGQVLAKASNTDLDFTWSSVDPLTILDAKGDLITATAADTPARLALGTNNQVLTVDTSTSTGIKWADAASGAYTLLTSGTLSGSAVNLTSISGSYRNLVLIVRNYRPATDNAQMWIRFNNDSTANRYNWSAGNEGTGSFGTNYFAFSQGTDNTTSQSFNVLEVFDYANTTTWKMSECRSANTNATDNTQWNFNRLIAAYNQTSAITEINILNSSGNFNAGDYYLYGVK